MKGDHHQLPTAEDMEDEYRQTTETDYATEDGEETQSVSSRNESGDSGPMDIQFSPTVPRKVTFEEYGSSSENDDRYIKANPSIAGFTKAHDDRYIPHGRIISKPIGLGEASAASFASRRSVADANRRENAYDSDDDSSEQSLGSSHHSLQPASSLTRSGTNSNLPTESQPSRPGPHPIADPRTIEVDRLIPLNPPNAPFGAQPPVRQAEAARKFTQEAAEEKLKQYKTELEQCKAELSKQLGENGSLRRRLDHIQEQLARSEEREDDLTNRLAGNDPGNHEIQLEELTIKNELLEREIADIKAEKLAIQQEKYSLLGDPAEVERLKEAIERAADFSILEEEWRRKCRSLEHERDVYRDIAIELRKQKDEAKMQAEYLVMQNLGEEALESARLEAEATKKLKVSEAQNENMHKEVVRLTRELEETKMDLNTHKKGGMLSNLWSSAPSGLPSASEVMAENRELKRIVGSLKKDLAQVREAQDDFLKTFDRESLGLGSSGDNDNSRAASDGGSGDDEGRAKLDIIYDRVHDLIVAGRDVGGRLVNLQHEIDRAVEDKDAAMERQLRDDERRLSVLAEIQQQAMDEVETLLHEHGEEGEVLDDLASQMLDQEAEMAGMSRDSDAFRAFEQSHTKKRGELALCKLRSRQKIAAMDKALDQAGDETYINLKIAQRHVIDLRSHSGTLERDNAELKRTLTKTEAQVQRYAAEMRRLQIHRRELAVQCGGRERELRGCQDELLLCQGEIDETREALDAAMLRLMRTEKKHGPLEEETQSGRRDNEAAPNTTTVQEQQQTECEMLHEAPTTR
ncbi:hypothetical protein MAPG_05734 [Magnaporthiopsis poae ATCC 64411]|uniref:Uncharacterized protein n=1 Tax=Magnaporthiopsis poae (strain ATCC 64411 / 73-15) TaxID=644358 RepID=A0A0C4E066_MAGP6|nr:hypothetical protein MAPG_05734 [Magnaporthiopsis poae ATCC 64411]